MLSGASPDQLGHLMTYPKKCSISLQKLKIIKLNYDHKFN